MYIILYQTLFLLGELYSYCDSCLYDLGCQQRIGYMFGVTDIRIVEITITAEIELPLYRQWAESNMLGNQTITGLQFMNFYFVYIQIFIFKS